MSCTKYLFVLNMCFILLVKLLTKPYTTSDRVIIRLNFIYFNQLSSIFSFLVVFGSWYPFTMNCKINEKLGGTTKKLLLLLLLLLLLSSSLWINLDQSFKTWFYGDLLNV